MHRYIEVIGCYTREKLIMAAVWEAPDAVRRQYVRVVAKDLRDPIDWESKRPMPTCLKHVETGDGYTRPCRVQDGSGMDVARAVGGTISRAEEEVFQDDKNAAYIGSN